MQRMATTWNKSQNDACTIDLKRKLIFEHSSLKYQVNQVPEVSMIWIFGREYLKEQRNDALQ